jgi:hypothetical protein
MQLTMIMQAWIQNWKKVMLWGLAISMLIGLAKGAFTLYLVQLGYLGADWLWSPFHPLIMHLRHIPPN